MERKLRKEEGLLRIPYITGIEDLEDLDICDMSFPMGILLQRNPDLKGFLKFNTPENDLCWGLQRDSYDSKTGGDFAIDPTCKCAKEGSQASAIIISLKEADGNVSLITHVLIKKKHLLEVEKRIDSIYKIDTVIKKVPLELAMEHLLNGGTISRVRIGLDRPDIYTLSQSKLYRHVEEGSGERCYIERWSVNSKITEELILYHEDFLFDDWIIEPSSFDYNYFMRAELGMFVIFREGTSGG